MDWQAGTYRLGAKRRYNSKGSFGRFYKHVDFYFYSTTHQLRDKLKRRVGIEAIIEYGEPMKNTCT
jgi:hypothetical protein